MVWSCRSVVTTASPLSMATSRPKSLTSVIDGPRRVGPLAPMAVGFRPLACLAVSSGVGEPPERWCAVGREAKSR
jgi:hypothetical protein